MVDFVNTIMLSQNLRPGKPPKAQNNLPLKKAIEICAKKEVAKIEIRERMMERIKAYPVK